MNDFLAAESLLNQVGLVVQNHEKNLRDSGNGFSFIHALDLERDEARFHTRFIGYLLNPKAGHFQGDKFLKLFFEALEIKESTDGFTVDIEKHVGKRDWENVEGGRIDILISNQPKNMAFAIEVKIDAAEQSMQLHRYFNYLKNKFKVDESKVFFLTLEGNESQFQKEFDGYSKISFRDQILKWIEICCHVSIDQPIIRETLTQYIANIKRLTNQNPDDQMSDEIIDLITKNDASFKAFEALTSTKSRLYKKFGEALINSIKESTDLGRSFDINFNNQSIPNLNAEISFFLKDSNDLRVRLYWLEKQIVGIGMHIGSAPESRMRVEMKSKLSEINLGKYRDNPGWLWLSEITELNGQPQLTSVSWNKFRSPEFAEKVASWVNQIADAYKEVVEQKSQIG